MLVMKSFSGEFLVSFDNYLAFNVYVFSDANVFLK